jgi:hypothetical protein
MRELTLTIEQIAKHAGYQPASDGKLNLPADQQTADTLAQAATELLGEWQPGHQATDVTLTGAGPSWAYLKIGHALHGQAARLTYVAPNAPDGIVIFSHGVN